MFVFLSITSIVAISGISIVFLDDPISRRLRGTTQKVVNDYCKRLADRSQKDELGFLDKSVLHSGVLIGVGISKFIYPEASALLFHYVYGDGSDLELSSVYFKNSEYLADQIKKSGLGFHGPVGMKQDADYRLSLALNPYYLEIETGRVRIYHPNIEFAPVSGKKVPTIIPLGKLKIRVYDNLISSLNPTPFYVYSEWER